MISSKFNSWLGILANLAVVAGIVFLGVEIQQNNALLEAAASQALSQNQTTNYALLMESSDFASLAAKLKDESELTTEESLRENAVYVRMLINWEWEFREAAAGRLPENELPIRAWVANIQNNGNFPTPRLRQFWAEKKGNYDADFVALLDSHLEE